MDLLSLILLFSRYGFLCFGGGYVLLPMMMDDFIHSRGLLSPESFGNLVSIAQLTPGPVGINTATFVGYTQQGIPGAVLASLALLLPSFTLAAIAVYYISKWKDSDFVKAILTGTRPGALALILYALTLFIGMSILTPELPVKALLETLFTWKNHLPGDLKFSFAATGIFIATILALRFTKLSMTILILASAILGAFICR